MPTQTEALVLQMSVDLRRMERSLNQARWQANRQLAAVEKRFDQMNDHVRRSGDQMARDLRASIAAIGVTVAIREVTQYADAWTNAQNKLAAAGVAQGQLNATMKDLVTLAQDTRSGLEATVDLYAKLTRAGQQLGLTQAQIRDITETTLQAFVAGGAAASEQAAAITQLSQALGSGVLQGDELRSIRENAPLLAQAIADEFNTTIAGLKKLGEEGELTADRVARAILNADGITEAFGRTITTVEQAVENLRTEFTRYIAESLIAQTVTQALGGFIQFVTDNLNLLADAAIIAASVIGGTLAVQAIGRFVTQLKTLRAETLKAGSQVTLLGRAIMALSPYGVVIGGIAAAFFSLAANEIETASAAEQAATAFQQYERVQTEIASDTKALEAAQLKLNKAIAEGGRAAQATAALELDAIRKRIQGNRVLGNIYLADAAKAVNQRSMEYRTKDLRLPFSGVERRLVGRPLGEVTLEHLENAFVAEARLRQQTREKFSDSLAKRAETNTLTEAESGWLNILRIIEEYRAEMLNLNEQLNATRSAVESMRDLSDVLEFPELTDGERAASGLRGFRTEVEALAESLRELRAARDRDASATGAAVMALQSFADTANIPADEYDAGVRQREQQVLAFQLREEANAIERSRQAVQAVLDFAQSGQLAEAFGQVPNIRDLLVGGDEALLIGELQKLAADAAAAVAVGFDAAIFAWQNRKDEIAKARAAAIAAGITDLSLYDRADAEADAAFEQEVNDLAGGDNESPYDQAALYQEMQAAIDDLDFVEAGERLREVMRDSVKNAMREGIRTGDWGDAFRIILADAITEGLDSALNRVADWLTDFLFGQNGFLSGLIEGAGNWAGQLIFGGRPTGGAVLAGRGYRVNDRGDGGEFLFMGSNAGQVLRAADIAALVGPSRGAGAIDASITFTGPIDASNMDEVRRMLEIQRRQIMAAIPGATRATIMADRRQGTNGWRKQ